MIKYRINENGIRYTDKNMILLIVMYKNKIKKKITN